MDADQSAWKWSPSRERQLENMIKRKNYKKTFKTLEPIIPELTEHTLIKA